MLRHLIIAALRNLNANRLQSAIAIIGLSIGIAAALIMALVVRNQTGYERFIPGYERTYRLLEETTPAGHAPLYRTNVSSKAASIIKLNAPEIESATRLILPNSSVAGGARVAELKRGEISASEPIYWADPNVFDVLPLPVFRGDLAKALSQPDGIVLPRATAHKYFGRDDVVGQTILLDGNPMTVRAVIEDLPQNATSLEAGIFASGLAAASPLVKSPQTDVQTYLRLKPGIDVAALEGKIPDLTRLVQGPPPPPGENPNSLPRPTLLLLLVPIDRLPLFAGLFPGAQTRLTVSAIVGLLVLFIASVNFVNLLTARAARRALEVGIRKVCGAAKAMLVAQFLGEAILTVLLSTCLAVALSEWLLPSVNAFMGAGAAFDYWHNPELLAALGLSIVVLGVLSGAYPAFVLSAIRPAGVLKGLLQNTPGAGLVRSGLVMLQFAILIGLVVAASVIYQQHVYSTHEGLRADIDQMLVVRGGCPPAFHDEVRKLPGVAGVSCDDGTFLGDRESINGFMRNGEPITTDVVFLDWDIFALYGIKPVAGTIPTAPDTAQSSTVIMNETAARKFGFASPKDAIGQAVKTLNRTSTVIAIVPDIAFKAAAKTIEPTRYYSGPIAAPPTAAAMIAALAQTSIRLKGQQIPETLAAIDRIWAATGHATPINRYFLDDHLQQFYLSLLRQAQLLAIFSGVAVFLASLGLLGLSISTADRRTKEIGIRKAMGAGSADVTRLLLWQFTKPVLWANLLAWPVAFYVMNGWLSGFAHHVALNPLDFVGATLLAVIVALLTVALQSTLAARAVPATALRYE